MLAKEGDYAQIRMPSGEVRLVRQSCYATIGQVGNLEYFGYLAKMVGLKKVPTVPSKLAIAGTTVFEKAVHLAGKTTDINPLSMIMLSRPSADYSHARARKLLRYRPTVTLEKGMQRCEDWLRTEGMIK